MRTWGIHFLAYLPLWVQIALAAATVGVAWLLTKASRTRRISAPPRNPYPPVIAAGLLFLMFRAATPLLGDGQLWLNQLEMGAEPLSDAHAPLLLRGLEWFYPFLHRAMDISALGFLRLVSVVSGVVSLLAWLRLGRALNVSAWLVLLTGFAWGGIALFFGYVEMYPPVVATVSWMLVLMISSLHTGKRSEAAIALALGLVSVALNLLAVVFVPTMAVFVWQVFGPHRRAALREVWAGSVVLLAACLVVYFAMGWYRGTDLLLPLFPPDAATAENPARLAVFSWRHIADTVNALLLAAGPVGIVAIAGSRELKTKDQNLSLPESIHPTPGNRGVLLAALIFPLAALGVHNTELGGARDWDIAAALLAAVPIAGIAAWTGLRENPRLFRLGLTVLSAWILLVIVPFVAVQRSEALAIRRFRDLLVMEPAASVSGWNFLGSYLTWRGDYDQWADCLRQAIQVAPKPRFHENLALYYAMKANWPAAEQEAQQTMEMIRSDSLATGKERFVTDPAPFLSLERDYWQQRRFEDAAAAHRIANLLSVTRETGNGE